MKAVLVALALVLIIEVWETSARCDHIGGDILIKQITAVEADYATGKRVKYRCRLPGYRIAGQTNNAKRRKSITCLNTDEFDQARPCCEKIYCKSPPEGIKTVPVLANMDVPVGTEYTYVCLNGYTTASVKVTKCEDGASWSLATGPTCQKVSCDKPMDGVNTELVPDGTSIEFEGIYVYECITGYATADPIAVVCQADGTFSSGAPNCTVSDFCASSPCRNGGTCTSNASGFVCTCTALFDGPTCEDPNPCGSNPCQNEGTCTNEAGGTFTCSCPSGYSGPTCGTTCLSPWVVVGNGCYLRFDVTTTWELAKTSCVTAGGTLAQPKTAADLTVLSSLLPNFSNYYWLGGGQLTTGTDVNFTWLDGTVVTVTSPSAGALASSVKDMLLFIKAGGTPNYSLTSIDEAGSYRYICQK